MPEQSATQLEEPATDRRRYEGLYRCKSCGGVVCRDRQGRKVTPLLGLKHHCDEWRNLLEKREKLC